MGLDNIQKKKKINLKTKSSSAIKKSNRKNVIEERRQNVRKKQEEVRRKLEDKNAQKEKLIKYAQDANPEDEERIKNDIAELEKEIQSDQMEIDKANKDIEMLDEEAGATDKESDDDDDETGDSQHQEVSSDVADALAEAFQKGLQLDSTVCTYKQADATLRKTQAILGYKQGARNGKVAIVAETDVPGHQIYRIRRDIFVSSDKLDIIQARRAGTGVLGKGSRGNIKWSADDMADVIGIAIEVPPGYKGNPEDLVLPIPRLSEAEKEEKKAKGERLPVQADVQLIIRWNSPKVVKGISDDYFFSFESRSGCYSIFGTTARANKKLYDVARTAEQNYRENGGKYSVEEALPEFDAVQAFTPIGSRQGSEEPDSEKNDKEKDGEKSDKEKGGGKNLEEEKKKQEEEEEKKKQAEEKRKLDEEKQKQKENAEGTEKSKKEKYEAYFRSEEGIDPNAKFTLDQAIKFQDEFEKASTST